MIFFLHYSYLQTSYTYNILSSDLFLLFPLLIRVCVKFRNKSMHYIYLYFYIISYFLKKKEIVLYAINVFIYEKESISGDSEKKKSFLFP